MNFAVAWNCERDRSLFKAWSAYIHSPLEWQVLCRFVSILWRTRTKVLSGVLSVDRCPSNHSTSDTMSSRHNTTLSESTPVRVKTGPGGFGISLGNLIAIGGIVVSGVVGFTSLRSSVEVLASDSRKSREELLSAVSSTQHQFETALKQYDDRIHIDILAAKQLANAERSRLELATSNNAERVSSLSTVVDALRPVATALPVLDQRVAAVERATNEFREAVSEMRSSRATQLEIKAELKELRADIKELSFNRKPN